MEPFPDPQEVWEENWLVIQNREFCRIEVISLDMFPECLEVWLRFKVPLQALF